MFKTSFTPHRELIILGQTIPERAIKHISSLNSELDYPHLTTFNISNITITLFDPDGIYNPNNPDNFWTQHQHQQTGYKGDIQIHIGYKENALVHTFDGQIANIRVTLRPPETIIEAVDASHNLRPAKVYDFGIPRKAILNEQEDTTYSGRYPFPAPAIPSERSVTAQTNITRAEMTDVGTIRTEGISSPLNYQVANNAIETEGGPLWTPDKPIATYKDAFRYKRIDTLIKKILEHYGINDYDIDIDPQASDNPHFASHGRPGWELENLS